MLVINTEMVTLAGMTDRLLIQMMLEQILKTPSQGPARVFTCTPHSSGTGMGFPDHLPMTIFPVFPQRLYGLI